jgi:hypothetical protein
MRRYTPAGFDPSTGRDDVPAALPTGATWMVAVTNSPRYPITANKHRAPHKHVRTDSNAIFSHCAALKPIRDKLGAIYYHQHS